MFPNPVVGANRHTTERFRIERHILGLGSKDGSRGNDVSLSQSHVTGDYDMRSNDTTGTDLGSVLNDRVGADLHVRWKDRAG